MLSRKLNPQNLTTAIPALGSVRRLLGVAVLLAALAVVSLAVGEYRQLYGVADFPTSDHDSVSAMDCPRLCLADETAPAAATSEAQTPGILNLRGFRHTIPFTPD
ncbi:MAG: hypothetical protein OXE17_01365 [Chloroflexi bacterium]|nr:hypothetical protein [Chloroflexota bacterium]